MRKLILSLMLLPLGVWGYTTNSVSTGVDTEQVWAEASGPNKLYLLTVTNYEAATRYLMMFATDSSANGDTPIRQWKMADGTNLVLNFNPSGLDVFSMTRAGVIKIGCTFWISTTAGTLTKSTTAGCDFTVGVYAAPSDVPGPLSVSGLGASSSPVIVVYSNNIVVGPSGSIDTTGTTTAGIQEAINSIPVVMNLFSNATGNTIEFAAGTYFATNTITIPNWNTNPINLTIKGQGMFNTVLDGMMINTNFIYTGFNPSIQATNPLNIVFEDIGLMMESNTVSTIVKLGAANTIRFNRCMIAWRGAFYRNKLGWSGPSDEISQTNVLGIVGVHQDAAYALGLYMSHCVFFGLADGLYGQGDDGYLDHCYFLNIGSRYVPGTTSWVWNDTMWTTGPQSVGAGVVLNSSGSGWRFTDCHWLVCGAALANLSAGGQSHVPVMLNCSIDGAGALQGGYRVLTYDLRPTEIKFCEGLNNSGDSILTNSSTGKIQPAHILPRTVYDVSSIRNQFSFGGSNQSFFVSERGSVTNAQTWSSLGGSVVFSATITTTTNLFIGRAGTASVNKLYTRVSVPSFASGVIGWWTNTATGGFVVDDSDFTGYNQTDFTEIYDKNTNSLYASSLGITDPGSIELMGFTPTGGAAGNPEIQYFTYSDAISSPIASLPQVVAVGTASFTTNFSTLVNNKSSTSVSNVTVGASPYNWTNNLNCNVFVIVDGGTAYSAKWLDTTVQSSLGGGVTMPLQPGEWCVITYTVAPGFYVKKW